MSEPDAEISTTFRIDIEESISRTSARIDKQIRIEMAMSDDRLEAIKLLEKLQVQADGSGANRGLQAIAASTGRKVIVDQQAEIERLKAVAHNLELLWKKRGLFHSMDGCICRFEEDGETQTQWCAVHDSLREELARHVEATYHPQWELMIKNRDAEIERLKAELKKERSKNELY